MKQHLELSKFWVLSSFLKYKGVTARLKSVLIPFYKYQLSLWYSENGASVGCHTHLHQIYFEQNIDAKFKVMFKQYSILFG